MSVQPVDARGRAPGRPVFADIEAAGGDDVEDDEQAPRRHLDPAYYHDAPGAAPRADGRGHAAPGWWDWLLGEARREYHAAVASGRPLTSGGGFFGGPSLAHRNFVPPQQQQQQDQAYGDYVDAADDDEDLWISQNNLDDFFSRVYNYYLEGGFACIVTKGAVNIATLGFTVVFSTFLLGFVDWSKLLTCKDEDSCLAFHEYVCSLDSHESVLFRAFVVLYCVLFLAYWLWTVASFVPSVKRSWEIRRFVSRRLGIPTRQLQTMEWHHVVDKMIEVQERGEYPIQINGKSFSAKDVVTRIMRRENYMIAMMSEAVLPVGTGLYERDSWFLGKNLELVLELAILEPMFDEQHRLRRHEMSAAALRRRFLVFGALCLALVPFSIGFMFIYSFLKYAEEFHSKRNYLGPRTWSVFALWKFREFNEVKHLFARRAAASMKHADLYIRQFPTPVPTVLAGGVSFVAGAFVAVLMLFTLMDESILLHIKLWERDLVWYIAIFSGALAISRSLVPPAEDLVFAPEKAMRRVVAYTHFMPDTWRPKTHTYDVRDSFSEYFQYKAVLLVRELLGILTTPYVLLFVLPERARLISEFIEARTVFVDGLGDVCIYSLMDLTAHGDPRYGSRGNRVETDLGRFVRVDGQAASRADGKLEKSWLNFRLNYPNWHDPQAIDPALDDRLAAFQREMVNSINAAEGGDDPSRSGENQAMFSSAVHAHAHGYHAMDRSRDFQADGAFQARSRGPAGLASQASSLSSSMSRPSAAMRRERQVPADHDYFAAAEMAMAPLDTFRYPSAENYFYWLEEYRENHEPAARDTSSSSRPARGLPSDDLPAATVHGASTAASSDEEPTASSHFIEMT